MLAIYFTSYEFLMRMLHSQSSPVCLTSALLSGGLAGVATYFTNYRIDYLKTLMQTDDLVKPRHTSMFGYYRETLDKWQTRFSFYGFQQQIPRAFFVNAAGFFCFEVGKKLVYNQTH
jgi:solute carrier family 25 carnitine/acylcarnitine transporter 20/29